MLNGLHFTGVELELKFVDLGQRNIAMWNERYRDRFAHYGTAQIVQGDSRRLGEIIVAHADMCVSSPPFTGVTATQNPNFLTTGEQGKVIPSKSNQANYGITPGNLGNLRANAAGFDAAISSPPFVETGVGGHNNVINRNTQAVSRNRPSNLSQENRDLAYGNTSGQLAAMRADGFDAAISSPPFSGDANLTPIIGQGVRSQLRAEGRDSEDRQQASIGNLAILRATHDNFDAAISSPPYEASIKGDMALGWSDDDERNPTTKHYQKYPSMRFGQSSMTDYGASFGQLGQQSGDDFWSAARLIVAQTFGVLRPGAHAIFVVKSFVRNGAIVDFPDQWRRLCESVGFVTLHEHRAWLVEDRGIQLAMDGNHKRKRTERKSFFRRLHEKKHPETAIDFEVVLCMSKSRDPSTS